MVNIKPQFIYYDTHSYEKKGNLLIGPHKKAKVASVVIADVYPFFEITSRKSRLNERHRVDINRKHLENLKPGYLNKEEGCVKIIEPEYLSDKEIKCKIVNKQNGFKEIAYLCDEKWSEIKTKCKSPKLRRTRRAISKEQQAELIRLTSDNKNDAEKVIKVLGL